jgi:hypothetical protein
MTVLEKLLPKLQLGGSRVLVFSQVFPRGRGGGPALVFLAPTDDPYVGHLGGFLQLEGL